MTASLVGPGGQIDVSDRPARLLGVVTGGTTGGATEVTLAAILTELAQKLEPGQAVALDAPTLAALETINAVVSGSVSVSNFPATQAVSGPLTDTQLRATPVPVTFPADETGLTDAELRATPVPVSGTITANLGTIDGAATETTLAALLVELGQKFEAGQAVALDGPTLAALETINAVVSGTVSVGNFPATQPVSAAALPLPAGAATSANQLANNHNVVVTSAPTTAVTGPLTDAQLRASAPAVRDDYDDSESLADQSGAGAVLTFTFAAPVSMTVVVVKGTGLTGRADPIGTPTASKGYVCDDAVPTYIPVITSAIKVFAPTGTTVSVSGMRRA